MNRIAVVLGALLLTISVWSPQLAVSPLAARALSAPPEVEPPLVARALSGPREAAAAQAPQGPGGGRGAAPVVNLPTGPTAVSLPTLSAEITGPGAMFDTTPSLPGRGLAAFRYEAKEYFVSGSA